MTAPLCPENPNHGEMKHVIITRGDVILGCAWFCVLDDREDDYCDGVRDCDCVDLKIERQMEMNL